MGLGYFYLVEIFLLPFFYTRFCDSYETTVMCDIFYVFYHTFSLSLSLCFCVRDRLVSVNVKSTVFAEKASIGRSLVMRAWNAFVRYFLFYFIEKLMDPFKNYSWSSTDNTEKILHKKQNFSTICFLINQFNSSKASKTQTTKIKTLTQESQKTAQSRRHRIICLQALYSPAFSS